MSTTSPKPYDALQENHYMRVYRKLRNLVLMCVGLSAGMLVLWICSVLPFLSLGNSLAAIAVILAFSFLFFSACAWWYMRTHIRSMAHLVVDNPFLRSEEVDRLNESRREIVAAFEIERRRIERDLHDGTQQYLVSALMKSGEAQLLFQDYSNDASRKDLFEEARALLDESIKVNEEALMLLRKTVHGIHPKELSDQGLEAALRTLVAQSPISVKLVVPHPLPDLPEGAIAVAYFFASEALTNVAKYAPEAHATMLVTAEKELTISLVDDGPGGAYFSDGHGLAGMRERLAASGGSLELTSPLGGPTQVIGRIPLLLRRGESGVPRSQQEVLPSNDLGKENKSKGR